MNRTRLNWMGLALLVLLGMQAMPAQAGFFDYLSKARDYLNGEVFRHPTIWYVECGAGLKLQRASGIPDGTVHTYVFRGFCDLYGTYDNGNNINPGSPHVSAIARWDKASGTYTETLHALAPANYYPKGLHIGTGPEKATFRCSVDPVLNYAAHCTLITQSNKTGWGKQNDGFAYSASHDGVPLLAGLATAAQAASRSKHTAIDCRGLHLADATGGPKDTNSWYRFEGTCRLYHSKSGGQGLRVTRVEVFGDWDSTDMQTHEGVLVTGDASEGGGNWRTTYTCNKDPWIHRDAQCSRTAQSRMAAPPVYEPITDLIARHPVALGMANASQAAKLSRAHHSSKPRHTAKKPVAPPRIFGAIGHQGMVLSRSPHLPSPAKPKLTIQYAIASSTKACDATRLLKVNVVIRNNGGPLLAHTRFAYVHAAESGGAHLVSPKVGLPAIPARETWRGALVVGTRKSFFPKLPGRHTLLVSIGPGHAAPGTLAYIPPLPSRVPVIFPAGYCHPSRMRSIGALMRGATLGGIHKTVRGKPVTVPRHGVRQLGVRKKLTPVTPVRRLNRPVQRLPKSQPTAGPRNATQQRGVRKKLTPVTPALRFTPAAPVRRLSLPAVQLHTR